MFAKHLKCLVVTIFAWQALCSTIIMNDQPGGHLNLPVGDLPPKISLQSGRGEFIWREKINKPKKMNTTSKP
jgi:hypothetical protein